MNRATTRLAERTSSLLASARTKSPSDYSSSGLTVANCDGLLPRRHSSRQATGHHPGTGSFLLDVSAPKCTTRSGSYTPTGADSARSGSKGFPLWRTTLDTRDKGLHPSPVVTRRNEDHLRHCHPQRCGRGRERLHRQCRREWRDAGHPRRMGGRRAGLGSAALSPTSSVSSLGGTHFRSGLCALQPSCREGVEEVFGVLV